MRFSPTRLVVALGLVLAATPAHAATSTICSGSVCQEVVHSGGTVTNWETTLDSDSSFTCATGRFYKNGGLVSSRYVCGYGDLTAVRTTDTTFGVGSSVCTAWAGYPGQACTTI